VAAGQTLSSQETAQQGRLLSTPSNSHFPESLSFLPWSAGALEDSDPPKTPAPSLQSQLGTPSQHRAL
jgi:hypothetical protein